MDELVISLADLFLRYLHQRSANCPDRAALFAAAAFLSDDANVLNAIESDEEMSSRLDVISGSVLDMCSSVEAAMILWTGIGLRLKPDTFKRHVGRICTESADHVTLRLVGGAVHDYTSRRGVVISVPSGVPQALLGSSDENARVIGLKLIEDQIAADLYTNEIVRALKGVTVTDRLAGLHSCSRLLRGQSPQATSMTVELWREIATVLREMTKIEQDNDVRVSASRHLCEIDEMLVAQGGNVKGRRKHGTSRGKGRKTPRRGV